MKLFTLDCDYLYYYFITSVNKAISDVVYNLDITKQEQVVLKKIIERKSRLQIANEMNITEHSVDNYLSKIMKN